MCLQWLLLVLLCLALKSQDSDEDGLDTRRLQQQTPRLSNSEMLKDLLSLMPHLSASQRHDLVSLILDFKCLFGDSPSRTNVLEHDIDVGDARPIKQHP